MKWLGSPDPATVCIHCHHGGQGTPDETHAKSCPQVTWRYPVAPVDVEMLLGCRNCGHVFELGEIYVTPLTDLSEDGRALPVTVVLCEGCAP